MSLHYDLHMHSTASDGTLEPAALVEAVAAAGVDVCALTDHDTLDGLPVAAARAASLGLRFVPGVEISVSWGGQTIHMLGLGVDDKAEALQAGLARLSEFRVWRAEEIGRRLARAGIGGCYAGARALAGGRIVGRTHFARHLVEAGHARSVREVFKRFLVHNKPGYVHGEWATLDEALAWVQAAGGVAVIAHPARYRMSASKLRRLLQEFREGGGLGMEVVSGSHTADNVRAMSALCLREELLASCGSDYHGPENPWIRLGELPALPAGCKPVWESEHWRVH